jgi:hypothetical protein
MSILRRLIKRRKNAPFNFAVAIRFGRPTFVGEAKASLVNELLMSINRYFVSRGISAMQTWNAVRRQVPLAAASLRRYAGVSSLAS